MYLALLPNILYFIILWNNIVIKRKVQYDLMSPPRVTIGRSHWCTFPLWNCLLSCSSWFLWLTLSNNNRLKETVILIKMMLLWWYDGHTSKHIDVLGHGRPLVDTCPLSSRQCNVVSFRNISISTSYVITWWRINWSTLFKTYTEYW